MALSAVFLLYHGHYKFLLTLMISGTGNDRFYNEGERHHALDYFKAGEPGLSESKCTLLWFPHFSLQLEHA